MKTFVLAQVVAALLFSHVLRAQEPVIVGHGDGEIVATVSLRVLDDDTSAPLADVEVVYFDQPALAQIQAIEEMRAVGRTPTTETPAGVRAKSDAEGRVALRCRFSAAFPISYHDGRKIDVPTQVFPDGVFTLGRESYGTIRLEAAQLFRQRSCSWEQVKVEQVVRLRKVVATEPLTYEGFRIFRDDDFVQLPDSLSVDDLIEKFGMPMGTAISGLGLYLRFSPAIDYSNAPYEESWKSYYLVSSKEQKITAIMASDGKILWPKSLREAQENEAVHKPHATPLEPTP